MRRTCYDLSPPCKQCERKCCRPGEYLSVMPADERTCKRKRRAPSSATCDLAKAWSVASGRAMVARAKVPRFQSSRARPTHAHASVEKKTRVAPFRGKTATKHATRLPMPKRSATTLLINISNPIWRGGRGRRGRPLAGSTT